MPAVNMRPILRVNRIERGSHGGVKGADFRMMLFGLQGVPGNGAPPSPLLNLHRPSKFYAWLTGAEISSESSMRLCRWIVVSHAWPPRRLLTFAARRAVKNFVPAACPFLAPSEWPSAGSAVFDG